MKLNLETSILFRLFKAKKTNDGKVPIYCRITINGIRKEFSIGKKVHPQNWLADPGIVLGNTPEAVSINKELTKIKADLLRIYDQLEAIHETVTDEMVNRRKTIYGVL